MSEILKSMRQHLLGKLVERPVITYLEMGVSGSMEIFDYFAISESFKMSYNDSAW